MSANLHQYCWVTRETSCKEPARCLSSLTTLWSAMAGRWPRAAAATEPLVAHLKDDPNDFPRAIIDALAEIGPAAKAALPAPRAMHEEEWAEDEPYEYHDRTCDPLGSAIRQIEGRSPSALDVRFLTFIMRTYRRGVTRGLDSH